MSECTLFVASWVLILNCLLAHYGPPPCRFRAWGGGGARLPENVGPSHVLNAGLNGWQDLPRDMGRRGFQTASAAAGNDFDWRQAIVLAGASFEAYFELAHKTNAVQITANGSCITYVDRCVCEWGRILCAVPGVGRERPPAALSAVASTCQPCADRAPPGPPAGPS